MRLAQVFNDRATRRRQAVIELIYLFQLLLEYHRRCSAGGLQMIRTAGTIRFPSLKSRPASGASKFQSHGSSA